MAPQTISREPTLEQQIRILMPEGEADAYILTPPDAAPGATYPGVIDLPDIKGIREATLASSRRLAAEGYIVLAPNVFYRTGRPPVIDFPMNFAEERTRRRFAELTGPLTPEAMHADAESYVAALDTAGAAPGPVGIVGHCFTGAQALRSAAAVPDRIAALAAFHGGHLFDAVNPSSPHRELPGVRASLYFGHASNDALMSADAIEHFEKALADWDTRYESEVYPAHHGWTVPDSAAFDATQADRAFSKLIALFRSCLHTG